MTIRPTARVLFPETQTAREFSLSAPSLDQCIKAFNQMKSHMDPINKALNYQLLIEQCVLSNKIEKALILFNTSLQEFTWLDSIPAIERAYSRVAALLEKVTP